MNTSRANWRKARVVWSGFLLCLSVFTSLAADTNIIGWRWQSSTIETNAPQMPTNVIALAGSDYHCVALLADRTVRAWGQSNFGQTNVPPDITNVVGIAAGNYSGLAATADGEAQMWGRLASGLPAFVPPEATNVVALGVGRGALHSVALRADGTVVNWGWDSGLGLPPAVPAEAFNIVSVAAGSYHALALRSDGRVISWGIHQNPVPASATNIVAIAAGDDTSVAIRADGRLLVWGNIMTPNPLFTNIVEVGCFQSGGGIALRGNGTVTGWGAPVSIQATNIMTVGADSWGALAVKAAGPPIFPFPAARRTVASGQTAYLRHRPVGALPLSLQWSLNGTSLTSATNSFLAVTNASPSQSGTYSLVASNALGVATNSEMQLVVLPFILTSFPTNQAVYVGADPTLSVTVLGQTPVFQWSLNGTNIAGATNSYLSLSNVQLSAAGDYSVSVRNTFGVTNSPPVVLSVFPILITRPPQDEVIFRGGTVAFSIVAEAGSPLSYQWRFNGTDLSGAIESTFTLTNVTYEQAGTYEVVLSTASASVTNAAQLGVVPVAAWGFDGFGQSTVPRGLTNVIAIASGGTHNLALSAGGVVTVWGDNAYQQSEPPGDLTNAVAVGAGSRHSLAVDEDGTLFVWGQNDYGQTTAPDDLTDVVACVGGLRHTLALKGDGSLLAWGNNAVGQTNVPGSKDFISISANFDHNLALRTDGTVVAWGRNNDGQTNVPPDLTNAVAVSAGSFHSLALRSDGTVMAWGYNGSGQTAVPTGLTNVVAVAAGSSHNIALKADGGIVCWGINNYGQSEVPMGLTNVVAIAAQSSHSLALVSSNPLVVNGVPVYPAWANDTFSVSLISQNNRVYRLEHKDSLHDINWVAHPLVAGTGGTVTFTDSTATGAQRFYRVRRW